MSGSVRPESLRGAASLGLSGLAEADMVVAPLSAQQKQKVLCLIFHPLRYCEFQKLGAKFEPVVGIGQIASQGF